MLEHADVHALDWRNQLVLYVVVVVVLEYVLPFVVPVDEIQVVLAVRINSDRLVLLKTTVNEVICRPLPYKLARLRGQASVPLVAVRTPLRRTRLLCRTKRYFARIYCFAKVRSVTGLLVEFCY